MNLFNLMIGISIKKTGGLQTCRFCCSVYIGHYSSGNALVSGARFKSRAGEIGHKFANGSLPLRHFLKRSCVAWAQ